MTYFEYPSKVPYAPVERQVDELFRFLTRLIDNLNHNQEEVSIRISSGKAYIQIGDKEKEIVTKDTP